MIAWSYGGGVQSAAIGVLICQGTLPKPDLAVIADTGRERKATWDYLRDVMQPYLDPTGLRIEVASHELAGRDIYSGNGDMLLPAFTAEGKLPSFCSGAWKRDVVERWLRLQGVKTCVCWIGFSIDEMYRVSKKDHRPWCQHDYPLINLFLNRALCKRLIEAAGLPVPPKSRCWCCPHQNAEEWAEVRADPEEWRLACELDQAIRDNDPQDKGLFLHTSRRPLALAPLEEGIHTPVRNCETASCWT